MSRPVRLLVACLLVAAPLGGCAYNPATGQWHMMMLSRAQEAEIGAEAAPGFTEEFGGAVPDQRLQQYVTSLGERLAAETEADFPELSWEFTLLDSSVINAFALPGGKVFITRGLAARFDNEAQMAGVLGHEIGHVTAQHANRRISKQGLYAAGVAVAAAVVSASDEGTGVRQYGEVLVPALTVGGQVVLLKYGRDEELEADWLGMRYMTRGGYRPSGQRQVMQILAEASQSGSRPPEWLSTHPHPESRIARIDELLAGEYRSFEESPGYEYHEARYQREFLGPLSKLPPARHTGAEATSASAAPAVLWCAHCAGDRVAVAASAD